MVKTIILRYILADKILNKGTFKFIVASILFGLILYATTGEIKNFIVVIILLILFFMSFTLREYDNISQAEYFPTPLNIIERKYIDLVTRKDLITFLGINDKERLELKEILKEYEEGIDLLKNKDKNEN